MGKDGRNRAVGLGEIAVRVELLCPDRVSSDDGKAAEKYDPELEDTHIFLYRTATLYIFAKSIHLHTKNVAHRPQSRHDVLSIFNISHV